MLVALRFRAPVKAGSRLVQAYLVAQTNAFVEDLFDPYLRREPYKAQGPTAISSLTVTNLSAKTAETAAPAETKDSPSRSRLLVCSPATAAEETPCARKILTTLARRAYRRPVTDEDLQIPLTLYREGAKKGGFEAGIELGVRSILVSPELSVPLREPAGDDRSEYALSNHGFRAGFASLVLPVEQRPG